MQRQALTRRLDGFGTSIFAEMTALARQHDAINLGQGFPNFDGPDFVKQAAIDALRTTNAASTGSSTTPASEVTIHAGARPSA